MTAPWMLEGRANNAQSSRLALTALMTHATALNARGGIIPTPAGTELQVTANGTPNKSVNIAPGQCFVPGSASSTEGAYVYTLTSSVSKTIDDGYSSNARVDVVAVRIHPGTEGGTVGVDDIVIVKGADTTGSPVPGFPSDGASYLELKRINVPSLATRPTTTVEAGDLSNAGRVYTAATGGLVPVSDGFRPEARFDGMGIIERPSGRLYVWNALAGRWRRFVSEDEVGTGRQTVAQSPNTTVTLAAGTEADLGPVTSLFTFKANQRYLLRCYGKFQGNAGITSAVVSFARTSDDVTIGAIPDTGRIFAIQGTNRIAGFESYYVTGASDVTMGIKPRIQPVGGSITTLALATYVEVIHVGRQ